MVTGSVQLGKKKVTDINEVQGSARLRVFFLSSDWLFIAQQPDERESSSAFTQQHSLLRLVPALHFHSVQGLQWSHISHILNPRPASGFRVYNVRLFFCAAKAVVERLHSARSASHISVQVQEYFFNYFFSLNFCCLCRFIRVERSLSHRF